MDDRTWNVLSLCSGIGGLDLAVRLAVPRSRTVCMVEGETACLEVLAARMGEGSLDACPVWTDLRTFDCRRWRGRVDCVVAGFPCQPASVAGKREGTDDDRWLWPEVWRVARGVGCRYLFVENVAGLLTVGSGGAFGGILADLAQGGWSARWLSLQAAEVGASHRRERLFLLAHAPRDGHGGRGGQVGTGWGVREAGDSVAHPRCERVSGRDGLHPGGVGGTTPAPEGGLPDAQRQRLRDAPGDGSADLEYAQGIGRGEGRTRAILRSGGSAACGTGEPVATATGSGLQGRDERHPARAATPGSGGDVAHAIRRNDGSRDGDTGRGEGETSGGEGSRGGSGPLPLFPPGPGLGGSGVLDDIRELLRRDPVRAWGRYQAELANTLAWRAILRECPWLAPALTKEETQSLLRGLADGLPDLVGATRTDQLRAYGNAVVPLQGSVAFLELWRRLHEDQR